MNHLNHLKETEDFQIGLELYQSLHFLPRTLFWERPLKAKASEQDQTKGKYCCFQWNEQLDSERSKKNRTQCPVSPMACLRVFVGVGGGGGVWTTDTYTLGLDCKTVGQNHFCKARSKAWYFRAKRVGLSPISLSVVTLTLQLSFDHSRAGSWPWQNTG